MKPVLFLAAPFALAACATVSTVSQPRHEGPAALGQATYVDGPVVTPLRIVEDSRCPMNARCVWAGRVVLRVRTGPGAAERDLVLGTPLPVADGALTLVSVTPDRRTDQEIDPRDYRFTFEFQGGL